MGPSSKPKPPNSSSSISSYLFLSCTIILEAGGGGDIGGGGAAMYEDENIYGDNNTIKLERDESSQSNCAGTIQWKRKLYDEISGGGGAGSVEGGASLHILARSLIIA